MHDYSIRASAVKQGESSVDWLTPSLYWKGGGKPRYLEMDFETYGEVDLGTCGSYRYIEDDSFEPLMLACAFDDEEVFILDLAQGEEVPDIVWAAIFDNEITKVAWNAQFERTIFGKMAGQPLSPDSWKCAMVWAASLSLPLALKNAAAVLKTGEQKDKEGERLIRYFSIPCKPTKANGGRTRNLPEHAPEDWEKFKSYCLQDVRTERDIRKHLERFPMMNHEWDYYHMDQRINDRGVLIDKALVEQAITCDLLLSEEMTKRAYELTGLENPNSVSQLKAWLEERGIEVPSLGKKEVAALITDLDKHSADGEALEMMKLRLQMAKSSVKKYQAADRYICSDGRAHGLFQFSGANRTQRWSGRGIQLQNLYRNEITTLDEARELLKLGAFDVLEMVYGNTPDILSQLIRTMLIPKDGCEFIVADFSAIEARVLAWLSGEQWRLDSFKAGEDIYCASASQMFGVPVVKHGVNGELRQKGKVAELACISFDSLVLTNQGLVPIQDITKEMKLWDGEEWVDHDGVVYRGEQEVITYDGLTATPDHLVWVEGKREPIRFGDAATAGHKLVQTGDGGRAVRLSEDYLRRINLPEETLEEVCAHPMSELRCYSLERTVQSQGKNQNKMLSLPTRENSQMVGAEVNGRKTAVRESGGSRISQLWRQGDKVRLSECDESRALSDSGVRYTEQRNGDRQDQYEWTLCEGKSSICRSQDKLCESAQECAEQIRSGVLAVCEERCNQETVSGLEQRRDNKGCGNGSIREAKELALNQRTARVYDIRNAGRRHRFTVSGKLIHNCGYGGSAGALISMGALDMGLKEEELPDLISDWRNANPNIVKFWWDVEKAAVDTVKDHQERTVGKIGIQFYANTLWLVLPSGRKLAYIKPRLEPNRFGRLSITYEGLNAANKWSRVETYSGKLVENVTQATARDLLAEAMWRMEKNGLGIVGHVHDEVILEVPKDSITVEEVVRMMSINPSWANGLPLNAAGYKGDYYFKD